MSEPDATARRETLRATLVQTGQRDAQAFRRLYRLTSAKLFGICLRICGERRAAEDVLQEVYLTIWTRAGGYDPARASPITWLATIARNRAIDWRRAHRPGDADAVERDLIVDERPLADSVMLASEAERRIEHCLDELETRPRDAIRTAFFEGVTYADLALRAEVPLGTMKSWVRRGLLQLRECLGDDA